MVINTVAGATQNPVNDYKIWYAATFSPSVSWFMVGILLLILELLVPLPTLLIAGAAGLGALVVAGVLAIVYIHISLQIGLWILSSGFFIWYSRRFVPKGTWKLNDALEGVTITEIPPGQTGRVKYEGNSWKARCENPKLGIPSEEKVYVMRKEGTTLIVVPENWLTEREH
ncbi:NfeD family protein [Tumidithrix elongata RA019]|uniref:NfeD family protein n=1 Tax=Tumidithrix elongata BACA0141 TaxID=2716417 RepID=A0AAW9PWH9_9CYAN|nr:NfeD family protein [Tumidithrix elongata RA019]